MTTTWNYGDPYAYMDRVAGGMPPRHHLPGRERRHSGERV